MLPMAITAVAGPSQRQGPTDYQHPTFVYLDDGSRLPAWNLRGVVRIMPSVKAALARRCHPRVTNN